MVKNTGRHWKEIASVLGKDRNQVKNRYMLLQQMEMNEHLLRRVDIPGVEELGRCFQDLEVPFAEFKPMWEL